MDITTDPMNITAGAALLGRLKAIGVDYIFANSGTDFPPIIEGLAEAAAKDIPLPRALTIPHESVAMGMAHGCFLATGKAQAVMVHTNVGLANCAIGAINAATEQIPMLLFSGRTPVTEKSRFGGRTVPIGWGQEMRDQSALVREACKWDYELRFPEQVLDIVDRAYSVACSTPPGPIYMSLPREVLCEPCPADQVGVEGLISPVRASPTNADITAAAAMLKAAENPLIIAQRGPRTEKAFADLGQLAAEWSIPVVQYWMISPAVSGDHPMNVGSDPEPWISSADVIVVIDCLAPWSPELHKLRPDVRIIHIGQDPLYARFPVRNFASHLSLPGDTGDTITLLLEAMAKTPTSDSPTRASRKQRVTDLSTSLKSENSYEQNGGSERVTKEAVSSYLSKALRGRRSTVFSELGCLADVYRPSGPCSWYQEPHSGGLGWAFPAALGMKLADPERLVVATMGDGSYMFANPVACHQIAEAYEVPLIVLVLNNAGWGAVRQSVVGMYPDGYAAKTNSMPLVSLAPSPEFTLIAEASHAWARQVKTMEEFRQSLAEAIEVIHSERRLALIDVILEQ